MAGDPYYFDNVGLLLHCDGVNNSAVFTDSSPTPKAVTVSGDAKISTTDSKFGGASAFFTGVSGSGYLSIPSNAAFNFGADAFTIEAWVRVQAGGFSNLPVIATNTGWTSGANVFYVSAGNFRFASNVNGNPVVIHYYDFTTQWNHVALVRSGNTFTLFLNGAAVATGSASGSVNFSSGATLIGATGWNSSERFKGYIDELRVTKGVARYTTNFTPPPEPFPDFQAQLSGTISESLAANTFIARAYDVADGSLVGSTTFTDTVNFAINIKNKGKAYFVTVSADGAIWQPSVVYELNAKVFPTDPVSKPYYYKRLAAGTSGATEPTWPTTAGGRCDDGAVTDAWELVERLIQPVTHGPLIPT
jgi:hypothetical protein